MRDGFCRTVTGDAWLYGVMPSQPPVRDAASWADRVAAAQPWLTVMDRLASLAPRIPLASRRMLKGLYRQVHILAISTPQSFDPSPTLPEDIRMKLSREYADTIVHDRFTLFGVRLTAGTGSGRREKKTIRSQVVELLAQSGYQDIGLGVSDDAFDRDRQTIASIYRDAGLQTPTDEQIQRAFAWWQPERDPQITPIMVEPEHMHVFPDMRMCRAAEDLHERRVDCATWHIKHSFPLTLVTLGALPFDGQQEDDPQSAWGADLMASGLAGGQGVMALSICGLVEPGEASREQIDRDKEQVLDKALKQAAENHKTNLKVASEIQYAADTYDMQSVLPPTLIDVHAHAAVTDVLERPNQVLYPGQVSLNPNMQDVVFQDMMIGSTISYNPSPCYWPAPILAYAGLSGRSAGGEDMGLGRDSDLPGALLGVSETDRIPGYISPTAVAVKSKEPIFVVLGQVGAGKTYSLLHLAVQWARMPNPDDPSRRLCGVFFNPKPQADDFGPFVRSMGGVENRLDDKDSEGILDPLRCMSRSHENGQYDDMVNTAVDMISQITDRGRADQGELMAIIGYGLNHGADCTGEAVRIAYQAAQTGGTGDRISRIVLDIYPQLARLASSSALFRVICGFHHGGRHLNVADGMTLISAGSLNVIPEKQSDSAPSMIQRWVVRMAALGGAGAIIGRNGFVVIDEAWALLGDEYGAAIVERFGRLARAQHYLPILASQKVNEFLESGVSDYISRGLILGMSARNEASGRISQAQAACMLFDQPVDGRLHERLTHESVIDAESNTPDWQSLYALRDPETGRLLRGPVGYYVGLDGRAIPYEIRIPDSEMDLIKGRKHA